MAEKRYYWLKLPVDFFESKRIKKLRKLAGGDTYTIIYLKMQLIAMQNDGILEYTGLENSFAEELALDIDEEPDNVMVTVNFLLKTGLLETSDNREFFVPFAVRNTGSESSSARRVRAFRERQNELKALHGNGYVTDVKRERNTEIEIESEIEEECSSTGKKTQPISSTSTDKSLSSSLSGESSDAPRKKHSAESDKVFSPDSLAYKCAVYLAKDIKRCLPTTPEAKEKDLQRWADAFDKTNRLDGHPWEEIRYVLVHCRKDPFWQKNILSGKKFREKYVRLLAEATAPRPETKKSPGRRQSWSEVAREMANDLEGGEGSG